MAALSIAFFALAALVIVGTFLPLIPTHAGIVRICDFPRPQLLVGGVAALIGLLLTSSWHAPYHWVAAALLVPAVLYQALRIWPFTPLMPASRLSQARPEDPTFSVLIANVKQTNRKAEGLLHLLKTYDPDLVFIVEIDDWWKSQLQPVAERYPHVTALPQDNGYGVLFMTRLTIETCEIRRLVREEIPSLRAKLGLASGDSFWFYGLHPEPPGPAQDAEDRDAELMIVAREMRDDGDASLVAGDLNDVAWSRTTASFRRIAKAEDPRRGRGLYATFHADYWFARWPLDHLFHTREFATHELQVLPHIGSDHFPVYARLSYVGKK
ncbi:Endonuclease/Exonuclease/phosphatase family protein [Methyloligella halotolerans]|uniref:Endonuclease/Exonuclease/phosphatase family protein n=1 Tax=Methyloligella halotolerans TaxID=1177755 RepID=A0A1E2RXD6_9HYPH|nr:endonuclease/exonuclease/phosphatase family protein [Methyloligella halotolerans]ODA66719.1 Endonuclease/Exonuclease/phosphatase family protein [Methyloligella halotolerans]